MKKNNLIKDKDRINLLKMSVLSHKVHLYGKNLKLNETDIDFLYSIFSGYIKLMERANNYEEI